MPDPDWRADLARYPSGSFWKQQSLWAIAVYRFGRRVDRRPAGLHRRILTFVYWRLFYLVETLTGISLPKTARIGPGLRIWHFGNIFLTHDVVVGARCTLRQGVTLGNRFDGGPSPVLEDDVELGAYAQVLGAVRVGRGAKVGAMSVVLQNIPPGGVAVGVPARLIERSQKPVLRPAVFLDRDGTLIENVPYLSDPDQVRLFPATVSALRRLQDAGWALVVVSNQSGIGRGMVTVAQVDAVNAAMARLLEAGGVRLDAIEYCPEAPTSRGRTAVDHPDRKPGPGLLIRAARNLGLDLRTSWMVGDMISDALAGTNAGCRGSILVRTGPEVADDPAANPYPTVDDLDAAVDWILSESKSSEGMTLPRSGDA